MNSKIFTVCAAFLTAPIVLAQTANNDMLPASFLATAKTYDVPGNSVGAGGGVLGRRTNGNLLGIDSLPNWTSYFYYPGVIDQFEDPQYTWSYTMVGSAPKGGPTTINAPIVPVTMDLRNTDGSPRFVNGQRLISSPAAFVTSAKRPPPRLWSNWLVPSAVALTRKRSGLPSPS